MSANASPEAVPGGFGSEQSGPRCIGAGPQRDGLSSIRKDLIKFRV